MRLACLLAAGFLLTTGAVGEGRAARVNVVVADVLFDRWIGPPPGTATVRVIAGCRQGRWTASEQSHGLLPEGAELTVFSLDDPSLGTLRVLDQGSFRSKDDEGPGEGSGLEYTASVKPTSGKLVGEQETSYALPQCVAVWHAPGSPEPRWVKSRSIPVWYDAAGEPKASPYRQLAREWLEQHGVSRASAERARVDQVLAADLNGDARDEVLLSVYSPDLEYGSHLPENQRPFSYLLMRYLLPHSEQVRTVVLDSRPLVYWIRGLCDVDGDGWAEVIATGSASTHYASRVDYSLYDWTGARFQRMQGWEYRG